MACRIGRPFSGFRAGPCACGWVPQAGLVQALAVGGGQPASGALAVGGGAEDHIWVTGRGKVAGSCGAQLLRATAITAELSGIRGLSGEGFLLEKPGGGTGMGWGRGGLAQRGESFLGCPLKKLAQR